MPALLAFFIVAISVIAITYKTYVGYGEYAWYIKLGFFIFLVIGWSAPFIAFAIRHYSESASLGYLTRCLYFLFGYVFFLFAITLLRDTIWVLFDLIKRSSIENMKNQIILERANIITAILSLIICLYGVYEAEKNASIKSYEISSPKIKQETKVVMLSDLHIDTDVSTDYIKNLVKRVNELNADVIVMVGDIIDNSPKNLYKQMEELKELKAKDGIFITLGNHEFYNGPMDWGMRFGNLRFDFLNNYGKRLEEKGLYIAGIPDINAANQYKMNINTYNALYKAQKDDYVIMLSHSPKIAEGLTADNVDLQLSGHTHGGQIFPFHYFTKQANGGMLAGFYKPEGINLYISRGTRYWGPPMRILAPSEITVFNLKPAK